MPMAINRKYWFYAKRYGWGWGLPASWQGWAVYGLWFAALVLLIRYVLPQSLPIHLAFVILMAILLAGICYKKGEPPRWRWGDQDG